MSSLEVLRTKFVRKIPNTPVYRARLNRELELIEQMGYVEFFLQIAEIPKLLDGIPFITRGSAGSSLVSYLMGVSEIDPVREGIAVTRFLNPLRQKLPDYDIDVPHYLQGEAHRRVLERWKGRAARISNNVCYRPKSALREAVRQAGYKKRLPRRFNLSEILPGKEAEVKKTAEKLLGQKKNLLLHCGGIIVFPDRIPQDRMVSPTQVDLDKYEVEEKRLLKIDLLSNRGLSQLADIDTRPLYEYPEEDALTSKLLTRGATIGVTQAESPAFRKMLRALQPRCRRDLIVAMGLIRPAAASRGRKSVFFEEWDHFRNSRLPVFEDQVTRLIRDTLLISENEADLIRRKLAKGEPEAIRAFEHRIRNKPQKETILADILQFREYSLCQSHGVSYGRMAWALAYQKARKPAEFWCAALNHCQSMYATFLYVQGAKAAGLQVAGGKGRWNLDGKWLTPADSQTELWERSPEGQYGQWGYWTTPGEFPGTQYTESRGRAQFAGLVAGGRRLRKEDGTSVTFLTVLVSKYKLIDIVIDGRVEEFHGLFIQGEGDLKGLYRSQWVAVNQYTIRNPT